MVSRELPTWVAPVGVAAVLTLAAFLRFWALGHPGTLVFDELYYVRDAISQLAHGYPTKWPDDDTSMATRFTSEASFAVHPPLGKWIIGLGILLFGDASGWGWRSAVAFCGVATVAVTMRLGWRITRSVPVALLAGLMLAIDGVHVVLTRVGLLDGILTLFVTLGALCAWRDVEWRRERRFDPVWARPWLVAAAVAFGAAASVKWSGLYPLAFFLLFFAIHDAVRRLGRARRRGHSEQRSHAWFSTMLRAFASGILTLPVTFAVYLASWSGWIFTTGGWGRDGSPWWQGLAKYHADMFAWHSTLSAPHPYQSNPLTWPLAIRPTAMYIESPSPGVSAVISPLPNPVVTLAGVLALCVLVWWIIRPLTPFARILAPSPLLSRPRFAAAFVLVGYLSGWLPWVLTFSRSAVFQFYAVVLTPFAALALALVLGSVAAPRMRERAHESQAQSQSQSPVGFDPRSGDASGANPTQLGVVRGASDDDLAGRRAAVLVFVTIAVVLALLFFPVWSGMPIPEWFARWHNWLPSWN